MCVGRLSAVHLETRRQSTDRETLNAAVECSFLEHARPLVRPSILSRMVQWTAGSTAVFHIFSSAFQCAAASARPDT